MEAIEILSSSTQANLSPTPIELIKSIITSFKAHVSSIDLLLRLVLILILSINLILQMCQDSQYYTKSQNKLSLCSLTILSVGIQHASFLSYPFTKKLSIQIYMTLLLVYISLTFEQNEAYLLVKPPQKDGFLIISYYLFSTVLLPNITAIVFGVFVFTIFVIVAFILQILAIFGFDFRPFPRMRINSLQNKTQIFKKHYKSKLNGYFYKHIPNPDRQFYSLDDNPKLEENSSLTIHQTFSCLEFKNKIVKNVEKRNQFLQIPEINNPDCSKLSENAEPSCSICYLPFKNGAYLIELPVCVHVFHFGCLSSWVDKNPSCPFCRFDLYKYLVYKNDESN